MKKSIQTVNLFTVNKEILNGKYHFLSVRTIDPEENCPLNDCHLDYCPPDNCPRGNFLSGKLSRIIAPRIIGSGCFGSFFIVRSSMIWKSVNPVDEQKTCSEFFCRFNRRTISRRKFNYFQKQSPRGALEENVFLEIPQNLQENTWGLQLY